MHASLQLTSLFFFTHPTTSEIYTLSYTTLFRSASTRPSTPRSARRSPSRAGGTETRSLKSRRRPHRSEEHTSELQSRGHLVCRLLLEKKKENSDYPYNLIQS